MSRSKKLIVTALFLIGACILLYPAVSNKLAERHQAEMISRYEQTVEELPQRGNALVFPVGTAGPQADFRPQGHHL